MSSIGQPGPHWWGPMIAGSRVFTRRPSRGSGSTACFGGACPANHTRVIIYFGPGIVGATPCRGSTDALQFATRAAIRPARQGPAIPPNTSFSTAQAACPAGSLTGLARICRPFVGPPFRTGCFGMRVAYLCLRRGFESPPPPHYRSGASDHPRSHGLKPLTRATKTGCSCRVRGPTFFVPFSVLFSLLGAFHPLTLDYCRFGALLCGIPEDWKSMLLERVSRPVGPA